VESRNRARRRGGGGSEPDSADSVYICSAYGFPDSSESQPGPDRDGIRRLRDFRQRTGKPRFPFVVIGNLADARSPSDARTGLFSAVAGVNGRFCSCVRCAIHISLARSVSLGSPRSRKR